MKRLSEAEQELMMIIWGYEEPASEFRIEEKLDPQKGDDADHKGRHQGASADGKRRSGRLPAG